MPRSRKFTARTAGGAFILLVLPMIVTGARGNGGDDVMPVFWSDNYFSLLRERKGPSRRDSIPLHSTVQHRNWW